MDSVLLAAILVVLVGILVAMKSGFNEVIKGLEALHELLTKRGST